ncbi:MAG: tetratricopeptide repeat protein [Myxococcales bacterium]|nr:tetratricopeptide repeat protein [Myxococcales bacterium]
MDEEALRARLDEEPTDRDAAEALSELLEKAERWDELAALLLARVEREPERVDLFARLGEVFERQGNDENALVVGLEAFGESKDDGRFGLHLGRLAAKTGQWDALLTAYERALGDVTARGAWPLHRRLVGWYEALDREEDAGRHLRRILVLKPDDQEALQALTAFYEQAEDWEGLTQLLRTRVNYVTEPEARRRLFLRVGRLLETKLNAPVEALEWLGRLYQEAPDDGLESTLERLAEESGAWDELVRIYSECIELRPGGVDPAPMHRRLGVIFRDRLDDDKRATHHYKEAARLAPDDLLLSRELRQLLEKQERFVELAHQLGVEAAHSDERTERYQRFLEQGDVYIQRLNAPREAVDAWFRALEVRPDDKLVLVRLMDAYRSTGQWEASLKVLKKLAAVETDPQKQAAYVYAMGIIQRDKLEDHYIAVRTLDRALELDPTMIKAFAAIDEILTKDRDYIRQDRYYRKMLARAREHRLDTNVIMSLARNLGEINRTRLGNYEEALKAYNIVVKRRPDDREARGIVAELCVLLGHLEEAARHYFKMIQQDVADAEPYHHLVRVFCGLERLDAAWCVCQALVTLGRSNEEENHLYEGGLQRQANLQVGTLDAVDWKLLTWASKNEALDGLFSRLYAVLGPHIVRTPKALGVGRAIQPGEPVRQVIDYAAGIIGVATPDIFFSPHVEGVATGNLARPALLIGPDLEHRPPEEVVFLTSRQLYLMGQQHFLATVDETQPQREARLVGLLVSVHHWLDPRVQSSVIDPAVVELLRDLPPSEQDVFRGLLAPQVGQPNYGVSTWLDAVEHTASRLGLLICNDLGTAMRQLKRIQTPVSSLSVPERARAMMLFALSEPYFQLRQRVGYAVGN